MKTAILVSTLALCASVNSGSLWIDEGFSAWLACHRAFNGLLHSLYIGDSSDLQMLLYNAYLWAWAHVFGSSEYALRAANFPFVALLVIAFALTSRLAFQRSFGWMPLAIAPFFWTYANEARAYFCMMACAAASTGALLVHVYGPAQYRKVCCWLCLIFLVIAVSLHMLAGFLLPAFAVIVFMEGRTWRDWRGPLTALSPLILLVGAFELWTLSRGEAYQYGGASLRHFLSVLYEFAGLAGLGPSRNVLRIRTEIWALLPYAFTLGAGIAALGWVVCARWKRKSQVLLAACAAGLCSAIAASLAMNSLFLGRHVSALFPLLLYCLLAQAAGRYRLALLGLVWLLSDARLSLLPEYAKDDYRSAVQYVVTHGSSASVVWAADPLTAGYYGLKLSNPNGLNYYAFDFVEGLQRVDWPMRAAGVAGGNWSEQQTRSQARPMLLGLSKPDLYDVHHGWAPRLGEMLPEARFQSFAVYRLR